jgi:hypothetical protein
VLSTAVGWTWPNPNSASYRGNAFDRRIADQQTLTDEVTVWEASRNKKHAKANWHFTAADARIKLKRLYPAM